MASALPGVFVVFMLLVQFVKRSYSQLELLVAFLCAWLLSTFIPIIVPNFALGVPSGARYLLTALLGTAIVVGFLAMFRTSDVVQVSEPGREPLDVANSENMKGAEVSTSNNMPNPVKSVDSLQRWGLIAILVGVGMIMLSLFSVRYWHPAGGIINNIAQGEILLEKGTTRNVGTVWDAKIVTEGRVAIPLKYPVGLSVIVILVGIGLFALPMTRSK